MSTTMQDAPIARNDLNGGNDTAASTGRGRSSARLNLVARSAQEFPQTPERFAPGSYNFAFGTIRTGKPKPAPILLAVVASSYELLGKDDVLLETFDCFLDACDSMRVLRGPAKIVRVADRALLKVRHPHRGRP